MMPMQDVRELFSANMQPSAVAERFIVADVERGYQDAADFTNRWVAEHPAEVKALKPLA